MDKLGSASVPNTVDRLRELKAKRQQQGGGSSSSAAGGGGGAGTGLSDSPAAPDVLFGATDDIHSDPAFLTMVEDIKSMRSNVAAIQKLDDKSRMAADEKTMKQIMGQVDVLIDDSSNRSGRIKKVLDKIKIDNDKFEEKNQNSARGQIRRNVYQTQLRRFHQTVGEYNACSQRFKEAMKDRTRRQLRMVDSNLSDADIEKVIASGKSAQEVIQDVLVSDDLAGVVEDIEERHQGILKLERQVSEVFELFKDLATLVDLQQESLDVISNNVTQSKAYAEKAETELQHAETYQKKARKRQCCILIIILGALTAILAPVIANSAGGS
jgi:syntaxin 1B/2/3